MIKIFFQEHFCNTGFNFHVILSTKNLNVFFSPSLKHYTTSWVTTITLLCESKYKWDYVIHKLSCGPTYKKSGRRYTQVFQFFQLTHSFSSLSRSAPKSSGRKIRLLFHCVEGSDHFDMLICSFKTAGICTCINSDVYFMHRRVKMCFLQYEGLNKK